LEALVFAHRCAEDAAAKVEALAWRADVPDWNASGTRAPEELILITQSLKEVKSIMSDYVGIVRNDVRLERAARRLDVLFDETEALYQTTVVSPAMMELRNLITIGYLIVKGAQFRKESRGLHSNTDYPEKGRLVMDVVL
jgi:L-aspartate oxidase